MILHRSPYHRHAQTGPAAPHLLFSEKRFENALEVFGGNADARIRDRQYRVIPFRHLLALGVSIQIAVFGGNGDLAAVRDCLGRIRNQVHDGFGKMDRRAHDVEQIGVQPGFHIDQGVEGFQALVFRADKIFLNEVVQAQYSVGVHPPAGQREQVFDDGGSLLAGFPDDFDRLADRTVCRHVQQQQVWVTDDARKDIIEVMGHATGQRP